MIQYYLSSKGCAVWKKQEARTPLTLNTNTPNEPHSVGNLWNADRCSTNILQVFEVSTDESGAFWWKLIIHNPTRYRNKFSRTQRKRCRTFRVSWLFAQLPCKTVLWVFLVYFNLKKPLSLYYPFYLPMNYLKLPSL